MDSSAPSILLSRVQLPSTPSMLLSIIVKFVLYLSMQCEKRTKINKKRPSLAHLKDSFNQTASFYSSKSLFLFWAQMECSGFEPGSQNGSRRRIHCAMAAHLVASRFFIVWGKLAITLSMVVCHPCHFPLSLPPLSLSLSLFLSITRTDTNLIRLALPSGLSNTQWLRERETQNVGGRRKKRERGGSSC